MKLDEYMPEYNFSEYHQKSIKVPPQVVYRIVKILDLHQSSVIKLLFRLRDFYGKLSKVKQSELQLTLKKLTEKGGFVVLDQVPNKELVVGLIAQPWKPDEGIVIFPTEQFKGFNEIGFTKVGWNFYLQKEGKGNTILSTEIRIKIYGKLAKILFGMYWLVIRPFSGLIRKIMLNEINRQSIIEMQKK